MPAKSAATSLIARLKGNNRAGAAGSTLVFENVFSSVEILPTYLEDILSHTDYLSRRTF